MPREILQSDTSEKLWKKFIIFVKNEEENMSRMFKNLNKRNKNM